ncbi:SRPBCC domain-containing protein [Amycolatopsis sp. NPDC023774]|uniref:SRPBCC family protein n=1 Tax=Amycolatopsis sp. NPDC023774 TaxID=3155015 RepID=UPI00340519A9
MGGTKLTSDDAVRKATGRGFGEWGEVLDARGARGQSHWEIVGRLIEEQQMGTWWVQTVTVEYERSRGLRPRNGGRNGLFTVSASRTIEASVEDVCKAVAEPAAREKWLDGDGLTTRKTQQNKSARFDWNDGATRVNIGFVDKGTNTQIALAHERIVDEETANHFKAYWRESLTKLKNQLENS